MRYLPSAASINLKIIANPACREPGPFVIIGPRSYRSKERHFGSGVLLSGQQTVSLAREYLLFTHFDEVWLFREAPMEPKPEGVSIVAPYNLSEVVPSEVADWMWRSGCVVGLGDGEGLNYVTVDEGVARQLSEY